MSTMHMLTGLSSLTPSSSLPHLFPRTPSSSLSKPNPPQTLSRPHTRTNSSKTTLSSSPLLLFPDSTLISHRPRSLALRSQQRPENEMSEDTDEMFDDLFDKYGKVVYSRNDQKPPAAEVDDDAESLSFAVALAKVANEVDAIGFKIRDLAEKQFKRVATGDYKPNSWTLLDFGDVVVHIFLPPQRAHYNLEEFYANATPIELPFENEPQIRR